MLPCHDCAYKQEIPGNAHLSCVYKWRKDEVKPTCQAAHGTQWFHWPINFDPVWGPDKCRHKSKKRNKAKVRTQAPMEDFLKHFI